MQYLTALARLYLAENKLTEAAELAEKMIATAPNNLIGQQLLGFCRVKGF